MIAVAAIAAVVIATAGPQDVPAPAPAASQAVAQPPPAAAASVQPAVLTVPPAAAPTPEDTANAIRDAFQVAQSQRGPLDGRWRLNDAAGRALLIFQLSQPGVATADAAPSIEGAWRDPNRTGATDSSGFLDQVDRRGDALSIRFYARDGDPPILITLRPSTGGQWRGELSEDDEDLKVVMAPF